MRRRQVDGLSPLFGFSARHWPWSLALALASLILVTSAASGANIEAAETADIAIAWDPVQDPRVADYRVHWGRTSGAYDHAQTTPSNDLTITGLFSGKTYYFAVQACAAAPDRCSAYSDELAAVIPHAPPRASFSLGPTSGIAPVSIEFSNESEGLIDAYSWDFGDGTIGTGPAPVHTYTEPGSYSPTLTVTGPGGTSSTAYPGKIEVGHPAPIPDFTANKTIGEVPLTVTFTDTSEGSVDACRWEVGDGTSLGGCTLVHTYVTPGVYTVTLEARGPDASATKTKADLITARAPALVVDYNDGSRDAIDDYHWDFGDGVVGSSDTLGREGGVQPEFAIETGEVALDHESKWVGFERAYVDPIVIVKPLTGIGRDPAVTRIDAVEGDGFWLRIQEWAYLDGPHRTETVGYIVVERGRHQLADGRWLEADKLELSSEEGYLSRAFSVPFGDIPVVISTVATTHDPTPVTTRLRTGDSGFEVALQEEEAASGLHGQEVVNYLAWEPSLGELDGIQFEVGRTGDEVTNRRYDLEFDDTLDADPVFLADMQSANGTDTANLRWQRRGERSVGVWVDEERSRDWETFHDAETLGYIAIDHTASPSP